jgi:ABC-type glycerol-3-phosphate transport system substrate-binding protein
MQAKVIKILMAIGGLVLAWFLLLLVFGDEETGPRTRIEFWNVFDTTETMEPLLKDFTAKTGIRVNYRNFTDLKEYRDTLLLELAGGEGPDVLAIHADWMPKYRNLLFPLPAQMGSVASVQQNFVDAVAATVIYEEEIPKSDIKKGRVPEIQVLGLPMYLDTLALFYNKTLFRNVLTKPYPAPELTWAGVRDDVIDLSTKNSTDPEGFYLAGIALGRADNITRGVDIFYTLYHQFGGQNLLAAGQESARDDTSKAYRPLAAALDFITAFSRDKNKEYSWNSEMGLGSPEQELNAFARGKVAMIAGYSYYYDEILGLLDRSERLGDDAIEFSEIGVAPFPQVRDPDEGNAKLILADFFALSVSKSSEHPFESWQLILELTSRASQEEYFEATKKPTSRRDLIETQKQDPIFGVFAEQAVFADVLPIVDDELFDAAIAETLDKVADGEIKSSEASRELERVFSSVTGE